jgi:hypothetical protein
VLRFGTRDFHARRSPAAVRQRCRVWRIRNLALGGLLTFQAIASAGADVLIKQTFGDLYAQAEKIVRARVVAVQSNWNADRSFIFTEVTLDVLQQHKGSEPGRLMVRVPGGMVGGYRISADSMPRFQVGDEVLVFLTRWQDGALKVAGYAQGLSRLAPSPQGPVLHGGALDKRLLGDVERELQAGGSRAHP